MLYSSQVGPFASAFKQVVESFTSAAVPSLQPAHFVCLRRPVATETATSALHPQFPKSQCPARPKELQFHTWFCSFLS